MSDELIRHHFLLWFGDPSYRIRHVDAGKGLTHARRAACQNMKGNDMMTRRETGPASLDARVLASATTSPRKVALPHVPFNNEEEIIFGEGVTYAIQIVAEALSVHPDEFSWDAATEEFECDVRSIVGNMLNVISEDHVDIRALLAANDAQAARFAALKAERDKLLATAEQVVNLIEGLDGYGLARSVLDETRLKDEPRWVFFYNQVAAQARAALAAGPHES